MQLPREVIVGKGVLERIPEVMQRLGLAGSALIVAGQKSSEVAGNRVKQLLEAHDITVNVVKVDTATIKDVETIEEQIKQKRPNVLFGVGGGTKIDAAKLSSAGKGIPYISVPTTLSHDGIASPLASVKGLGKPYSVMVQAPLAIIADTDAIMQAPWRSVVSGCGDVISKLTAVKDWQLAQSDKNEYYGEYSASLALMSARLIIRNAMNIEPGNEEGPRILLEALISCGVAMSIAGSSRPCSGSEHLFSHALDQMNGGAKAMHGEQCGVGAILAAYLQGQNWRRVRNTLKQIRAPTTARELGIKDKDVVKALQMAAKIRPDRYTILHKLNLKKDACERAARNTGVMEGK
jgi:glycerol-1-phosphate dehydrogenase [NAD(P)+]